MTYDDKVRLRALWDKFIAAAVDMAAQDMCDGDSGGGLRCLIQAEEEKQDLARRAPKLMVRPKSVIYV